MKSSVKEKRFGWARVLRRTAAVLLTIGLVCGCMVEATEILSIRAGQAEDGDQFVQMEDSGQAAYVEENQEPVEPEGTLTEPEWQESPDVTGPEIADEPGSSESTQNPQAADDGSAPEYEGVGDVQRDLMYIRVNDARVYALKGMTSESLFGRVTGIALALHYTEDVEQASRRSGIHAAFITTDGAWKGFFAAGDVQALDYEEALAMIGRDTPYWYADAWPMRVNDFLFIMPQQAVKPTPSPKPVSESVTEVEPASSLEPTPEPTLAPDALHPADESAQSVLQDGSTYIQLRAARVFSDAQLTPESFIGRVTGVAITTAYRSRAANGGGPATLAVMFKAGSGLRTGFVRAADAKTLEYEATLTEILGEGSVPSGDPWPLPMAAFETGELAPEAAPNPEAGLEPELTPNLENGLEPEVTPNPETDLEPEPTTNPDTDVESEEIPNSETDLEPEPTPDALYPDDEAGQAIVQGGSAYVQLYNRQIFSNARLIPESLQGRVTGIALATSFIEENTQTGQPAVLALMFKTETCLRTGFVRAAEAEVLDYETALSEILGGGQAASDDSWPLPVVAFLADNGEPASELEPEAEPEETPAPYVLVSWNCEGDLLAGTPVELRAEVFNLPEERIAGYQWKNNLSGEFEDVPEATGAMYTFLASAENTGCEWIVEVKVLLA